MIKKIKIGLIQSKSLGKIESNIDLAIKNIKKAAAFLIFFIAKSILDSILPKDLLCIKPILIFLIINQNILEKFFLSLFFHSPL